MKKGWVIFWVLYTIVMMVGLPLVISLSLRSEGKVEALPLMEVYEVDGRPVVAMMVEELKATSNSEGYVSGHQVVYAQARYIDDGKQLWRTLLETDKWVGAENLLIGQSETHLYIFSGELFVVNKLSGAIEASCESLEQANPQMKSLFPSAKGDYYVLNGALLFIGNDGELYKLADRGLTVEQCRELTIDELKRKIPYRFDSSYEQALLLAAIDEGRWLGIITAGEKAEIEKFHIPIARISKEDSYRMLFEDSILPLDRDSIKPRLLVKEPFMWGGFLKAQNSSSDYALTSSKEVELEKLLGVALPDTKNYYTPPTYEQGAVDYGEKVSAYMKSYNQQIERNLAIDRKLSWLRQQLAMGRPLKTDEGYWVIHRADQENTSEILISCVDAHGSIVWTVHTSLSNINFRYTLNNQLLLGGAKVGKYSSGITRFTSIDLRSHSVEIQDIDVKLFTSFPAPYVSLRGASLESLIFSFLNILFLGVALLYVYRILTAPWRAKKRLEYMQRNGKRITSVVLSSNIEPTSPQGYAKAEITVEFENLSHSRMTQDFKFMDSKPFMNRYHVGAEVTLLADPTLKNKPSLVMAGGEGRVDFSTYRWTAALTLIVLSLILLAFYLPYGDVNGNLLAFGSASGALSMIMYSSVVLLVVFVLIRRLLNVFGSSPAYTLYGIRTQAQVLSVARTGMLVNHNPEVQFNIQFVDHRGNTQRQSVKKVVDLIAIGNVSSHKVLDIVYLPNDTSKIQLLTQF